jgi:hypothetical protein
LTDHVLANTHQVGIKWKMANDQNSFGPVLVGCSSPLIASTLILLL